jgi:cytochrome c553
MRLTVVILTLVLSFIAPLATSIAAAAEPGVVQAQSRSTACKRKRAKKQSDDKPKKKDKEGKKPYGFEL